MAALEGARVALLEWHASEEAAAHVRRLGGVPYCVPAIRETRHLERVAPFIDELSAGRVSVVIFLTAAGAAAFFDEATRLGRLDEAVAAIGRTAVACRGPKPAAVLRRHEVPIRVVAAAPATSREVLHGLDSVDVSGRTVVIISSGVQDAAAGRLVPDPPSRILSETLAARGAQLESLPLYEWAMPEDLGPLSTLVGDLIGGRVEAIAFTNRIQARHLFQAAAGLGVAAELAGALNGEVIVAVVGPVCAEALQAIGVVPDIIPARPTMESMIGALAEYVDLTRGLPD